MPKSQEKPSTILLHQTTDRQRNYARKKMNFLLDIL